MRAIVTNDFLGMEIASCTIVGKFDHRTGIALRYRFGKRFVQGLGENYVGLGLLFKLRLVRH
ncbi:hypothetical protein ASL20_22815 [Cupriavidus necator]|nr:hypothetical protein ASL20_22815 [Cupriavidus necator]